MTKRLCTLDRRHETLNRGRSGAARHVSRAHSPPWDTVLAAGDSRPAVNIKALGVELLCKFSW
jgi:hypothetical protein